MKPKFRIGDWVKFSHHVGFYYDENEDRKIVRLDLKSEITGQVVGAAVRFLGKFKNGSYKTGYYGEEDNQPPYLEVKSSQIVWLVREGYLNIPYEVLESDLKFKTPAFHNYSVGLTLPWRKVRNPWWTDRNRADQRKYMKDVKRDSKGRWLKY